MYIADHLHIADIFPGHLGERAVNVNQSQIIIDADKSDAKKKVSSSAKSKFWKKLSLSRVHAYTLQATDDT